MSAKISNSADLAKKNVSYLLPLLFYVFDGFRDVYRLDQTMFLLKSGFKHD